MTQIQRHVDSSAVLDQLSTKRGTISAVIWVWVLVCVLAIGVVAVLVAGSDNEMADVYDDRPDVSIPTGRALVSGDLEQLRFSTGLRGYRMDEVDAFVARVKADLLTRADDERGDAYGHSEVGNTEDDSSFRSPAADHGSRGDAEAASASGAPGDGEDDTRRPSGSHPKSGAPDE